MSTKHEPSTTDLITLGFVTNARISPTGDKVAFISMKPDWNKNRYEKLCFIHNIKEDKTYQLTRSGSVSQFEWINNDSLAILKQEANEK